MKYIIYGIKGIAIGIANAIPGVSGGTIALIVGIYKKLMDSIGKFFKMIKDKETRKDTLLFLGAIVIGAGAGVYLFAKLMTALTRAGYTQPLYFFFGGLIIGSVPYIIKINKDMKLNAKRVGVFLLGFALVIGLIVISMNREKTNDPAPAVVYETGTVENVDEITNIIEDTSTPAEDENTGPGYLVWLAVCGFLAAGSMIVPGFSGSALLVALGEYENILYFVDQLQITPLIFVAGGAALGIFLFAKLIAFLLEKYTSGTYYFILGLIFASFYQIWLKVNEGGFSYDIGMLLISFIGLGGGFAIAYFLGRYDLKKNPQS